VLNIKNGDQVTGEIRVLRMDEVVVVSGGVEKAIKPVDATGMLFPSSGDEDEDDASGWYARVVMPNRDSLIGVLESLEDDVIRLSTRYCGEIEIDRGMASLLFFGETKRFNGGKVMLSGSLGVWAVKDGEQVWSYRCMGMCDARWLPGGGVLISARGMGYVLELDADGAEKMGIEGLKICSSAVRLQDGRTVVCERAPGQLNIFNLEGRLEKTVPLNEIHPWFIDVMSDGNLLVTDIQRRKVAIMDLGGKILWERQISHRPHCARVMQDGMIAVMDQGSGDIAIYNRVANRLVRTVKFDDSGKQFCFEVLPDGNLLVAVTEEGTLFLREISPENGATIRETPVEGPGGNGGMIYSMDVE
jgi:hypothetical protein